MTGTPSAGTTAAVAAIDASAVATTATLVAVTAAAVTTAPPAADLIVAVMDDRLWRASLGNAYTER